MITYLSVGFFSAYNGVCICGFSLLPAGHAKSHLHSSQVPSFVRTRIYTHSAEPCKKASAERRQPRWKDSFYPKKRDTAECDEHSHTLSHTHKEAHWHKHIQSVNALLLLLLRARKRAGRLASSMQRMDGDAKCMCGRSQWVVEKSISVTDSAKRGDRRSSVKIKEEWTLVINFCLVAIWLYIDKWRDDRGY